MKLREYLFFKKIKAKDFATKCGLTPSHLSAIVTERTAPNVSTAIKIVEATEGQVDFKDLVKEKKRKVKHE